MKDRALYLCALSVVFALLILCATILFGDRYEIETAVIHSSRGSAGRLHAVVYRLDKLTGDVVAVSSIRTGR